MTDPDTTLKRIDDVLGTCICGVPLTKTGASLDYCTEDCQQEWQANVGRLRNLPGLVKLRRADLYQQIADQACMEGRVVVRVSDGQPDSVVTGAEAEAMFRAGQLRDYSSQITPVLVQMALQYRQRMETFEVIVPGDTERADYLEAAGGDIERAISLAQWGIPASLAAANPGESIRDLAYRAHVNRSTT